MVEEARENFGLPEQERSRVYVTAEGFKIFGVNETSLIRSLKSLGGIPIAKLETDMKPGNRFHGLFLGDNESLIQILAQDNDTVLEMGLTHQKLAEFLFFVSHAKEQDLEYNGRRYARSSTVYLGSQPSPFEDGTSGGVDYIVVCLEDGSSLSYSELLPFMIDRYGFYEGKGTSYRLDPEKIAETAGFISLPQEDPVIKLIKDSNEAVDIATGDQLKRLYVLANVGSIDLMGSPNYHIVPQDADALLAFCSLFPKEGEYTSSKLNTARRVILSHLVINKPLSKPYKIDSRDSVHTLINIVPRDFPQLKRSVLDSIESIEFPDGNEGSYFLDITVEAIFRKHGILGNNPHKRYLLDILQKVKRDSITTFRIYQSASRAVMLSDSAGNAGKIAGELKDILLSEDIIEAYKKQGIPIREDMNLKDLLLSREGIEAYKKEVGLALQYARNYGDQAISEADVSQLVAIIARRSKNLEYPYDSGEIEALKRLGLDLRLIPYAFGNAPNLSSVVAQLFNGSAKKELGRKYTSSKLEQKMQEDRQGEIRANAKYISGILNGDWLKF